MKANATFLVVVVLTGTALLLGFWGCGTGPIEQSYAIQSGATPVSPAAIAEVTKTNELSDLMKQMRTANLNLVDRLTAGSPEQVMRASVDVSVLARQVSGFEPAVATGGEEEVAAFKRLAHQVQDMAVEVAKAADAGDRVDPDGYYVKDKFYVRLLLTCNQCHRLFRGVAPPAEPMPIPELETPTKPAEKPPEEAPAPAPAPEPAPLPTPPPAPPEPAPRPPE